LNKKLLSLIDSILKSAKEKPQMPFGGVHVFLGGDFHQLPPVAAAPIYHPPSGKMALEVAGYDIWHNQINTVFFLRKNYRFQVDEEYGEIMQRMHEGKTTIEDISRLNSRVVDSSTVWPTNIQIVSPQNEERISITDVFVVSHISLLPPTARWQSQNHIRIYSSLNRKESPLDDRLLQYIYNNVPDYRCGFMAPVLDIWKGLPVMVTNNKAAGCDGVLLRHVGNGTMGIVEGIVLKEGVTPSSLYFDQAQKTIWSVKQSEVHYIIIRRPDEKFPTLPDFPANCFPIIPITKKEYQIPIASGIKISLSITQFPIIPAHCISGHKMQGNTVDNVCITQFQSHPAPPKGWTYVTLSRVTRLSGLYLLSPVPTNLKHYQLSDELLAEEERLKRIETETVARLEQASEVIEPQVVSLHSPMYIRPPPPPTLNK